MNARERRKADEIANYARAVQSKLGAVIERAETGRLKGHHLLWLHLMMLMEGRLDDALVTMSENN
jgi:hypothetical protein